MKELKNYILVGVFTGLAIYFLSPNMFGNRIEIIESTSKKLDTAEKYISYHDTVDKVNKSVVSIYTKKSIQKNTFYVDPKDKILRRKAIIPTGQGSGVVVSSQGHIITNFHVIAGSDEILIRDYLGKDYGTAIIGVDPLTDLAILKIDHNTVPITFGKIEQIKIGDVALAIGNPLGIGQTITLGIVSATDKEIGPGTYSYQRYVQTDAAINPGNSGGALVNTNGELIGINTSIITQGGGSDGIGFAIPVDTAKHIFTEIIKHGEVIRGFVGIAADPYYRGNGILVKGVYKNGPGDNAGIKPNDIIKKIDNFKVQEVKDIQNIIGKSKPGNIVSVELQRGSDILTANIIIEKMNYGLRE